MEIFGTWEAFKYAYKVKKEIGSFLMNYKLKKLNPLLYLPLKNNFINLIETTGCGTYVYPYLKTHEEGVDKVEFRNDGYYFNGTSMVNVHLDNLPRHGEARSFSFAIKPTEFPKRDLPMFFFSYGRRIHDEAFGFFCGIPQVEGDQGYKNQKNDVSYKIFTYCAIKEELRKNKNCDFDTNYNMDELSKWIVVIISYDGKIIRLYIDGKKIYEKSHKLKTYASPYLNIGGFLHYTEDGTLNPKDMEYSMKGYIREFMVFDRGLNSGEVKHLNNYTQKILQKKTLE